MKVALEVSPAELAVLWNALAQFVENCDEEYPAPEAAAPLLEKLDGCFARVPMARG